MSERDFSKIKEIAKQDFKSMKSHPVVIIVLIAIMIIPSLYALINIDACWDPYGSTGNIEFVVANLDEGSVFEGEKLNLGDMLESELKNNSNFDWTFVSEQEVKEGVENGVYYSGIIIPKNFTKTLLSISNGTPESANLEYYVNIKENPIANKLSDTGANTVYKMMNSEIVTIVDLMAYDKLNELQSKLSSGNVKLTSGAQKLSSGASKVSSGADQLSSGAEKLKSGANKVSNGADKLGNVSSEISTTASNISKDVNTIVDSINTSEITDPEVKQNIEEYQKSGGLSQVISSGAAALSGNMTKLSNGVSKLSDGSVKLANGSQKLASGSSYLANSAASALLLTSSSLSNASSKLDAFSNIDESELGSFLLSPIKLDRHEFFPVDNFGSNVAPFYLVLSMWVGAILTCIMLKPGRSAETKYTPLEIYYGKLPFFLTMSVLQTTVTMIGAAIMGIQMSNPLLYILSSYLIAMVFMTLIYSFVSALGVVGNGLAVLLLVFQICGSGGVYPIEIMDPFFSFIYPFMPMSYAIDLLREAMLGSMGVYYLFDMIIIIIIGILTILILSGVKRRFDDLAHFVDKKLEASGLFK